MQPRLLRNVVLAGELRWKSKLHQHRGPRAGQAGGPRTCPLGHHARDGMLADGDPSGKDTGGAVSHSFTESDEEQAAQSEKSGAVDQERLREATMSGQLRYVAALVVMAGLPACGDKKSEDDSADAACTAAGGQCVGVGDCDVGVGHLDTTIACSGGASTVCCQPTSACGGPDEFVCCSGSDTARPDCISGELTCKAGMTQSSTGTCGALQCPATGATPTAPGCKLAGGVCVGQGQCGGAVDTAHSAECTFDDVPGDCCVAPSAASSGDTCVDVGGVCAPIAGCGFVNGWRMMTSDCRGVGFQCCVPQGVCGDIDAVCCGDTWSSVASCVRGDLVCQLDGHTLMCSESCTL